MAKKKEPRLSKAGKQYENVLGVSLQDLIKAAEDEVRQYTPANDSKLQGRLKAARTKARISYTNKLETVRKDVTAPVETESSYKEGKEKEYYAREPNVLENIESATSQEQIAEADAALREELFTSDLGVEDYESLKTHMIEQPDYTPTYDETTLMDELRPIEDQEPVDRYAKMQEAVDEYLFRKPNPMDGIMKALSSLSTPGLQAYGGREDTNLGNAILTALKGLGQGYMGATAVEKEDTSDRLTIMQRLLANNEKMKAAKDKTKTGSTAGQITPAAIYTKSTRNALDYLVGTTFEQAIASGKVLDYMNRVKAFSLEQRQATNKLFYNMDARIHGLALRSMTKEDMLILKGIYDDKGHTFVTGDIPGWIDGAIDSNVSPLEKDGKRAYAITKNGKEVLIINEAKMKKVEDSELKIIYK